MIFCFARAAIFAIIRAMNVTPAAVATVRRPKFRFQEGGLLVVVFVLGLLLTIFGGKVRLPAFETNAQGERQRVFTTNATGEKEPAFIEKNKFLNVQNLAQLAKDTSFIAIMAVGATFVIISGGIDLSVGAIYALASVLAAMVFAHFGPDGPGGGASGWGGVLLGILSCVGVGAGGDGFQPFWRRLSGRWRGWSGWCVVGHVDLRGRRDFMRFI